MNSPGFEPPSPPQVEETFADMMRLIVISRQARIIDVGVSAPLEVDPAMASRYLSIWDESSVSARMSIRALLLNNKVDSLLTELRGI